MPAKSRDVPRVAKKGDDFDIPAFCIIAQSKRNRTWEQNPPRAMQLLEVKAEVQMDPSTVAFLREQERRDAIRKEHGKARLRRIIPKSELRNMRWDPMRNKFVPDMFTASGVPIQTTAVEVERKPKKVAVDDLGAQVIAHTTDDGAFNAVKLKRFAKANGVWDDKYASLNNGLQRMNIVNRLRGKVRKDADYKVV